MIVNSIYTRRAWALGILQPHLNSRLNTWLQWIGQRQLQDEMGNIQVLVFGVPYIRGLI